MIGAVVAIGLLVCLCGLLAFLEVRRIRLNREFKHIPGKKQYPIIGTIYTLKPNRIQGNCCLWFDPSIWKSIDVTNL